MLAEDGLGFEPDFAQGNGHGFVAQLSRQAYSAFARDSVKLQTASRVFELFFAQVLFFKKVREYESQISVGVVDETEDEAVGQWPVCYLENGGVGII